MFLVLQNYDFYLFHIPNKVLYLTIGIMFFNISFFFITFGKR